MGLIQAAVGAAGGALADSWRDFFYCDSLDEDTLVVKGQKRVSEKGRSSNVRGEENIISNGSIVAVNDGQCAIIVESGEIVEFCAQAGKYEYDISTEPSLFYGDLGEGIRQTFERIGQRLMFGGDTGKDQRIYYFNTKEIYGNKYGTSTPIPMRIVDTNINLDLEAGVRMNGEFSFRIADPLLFYKNVCGNVEEPYTRDRLESQMKSELLLALQPALARISEMGIRYSAIPAHTRELANVLNEELSEDWLKRRGIEVVSFGVNSISLSEEDEKLIKDRQAARSLSDPNLAAGYTAGAYGDAMRTAAANENGAIGAFMGMGMANNMGGAATAQMFQQGGGGYVQQPQQNYPVAADGGFGAQPFPQTQPQPQAEAQPAQANQPMQGQPIPAEPVPTQPAPQPQPVMQQPMPGYAPVPIAAAPAAVPADGWACPTCGAINGGNFCQQCGTPKPVPQAPAEWACPTCGTKNAGNFCGNCGTPKPQA